MKSQTKFTANETEAQRGNSTESRPEKVLSGVTTLPSRHRALGFSPVLIPQRWNWAVPLARPFSGPGGRGAQKVQVVAAKTNLPRWGGWSGDPTRH